MSFELHATLHLRDVAITYHDRPLAVIDTMEEMRERLAHAVSFSAYTLGLLPPSDDDVSVMLAFKTRLLKLLQAGSGKLDLQVGNGRIWCNGYVCTVANDDDDVEVFSIRLKLLV